MVHVLSFYSMGLKHTLVTTLLTSDTSKFKPLHYSRVSNQSIKKPLQNLSPVSYISRNKYHSKYLGGELLSKTNVKASLSKKKEKKNQEGRENVWFYHSSSSK